MLILIIGGTRFIGPHVAAQLVDAGHGVTVYHRGEHEPELPKQVRHVHSADAGIPILRFAAELLREGDAVIHMMPIGEADTRAFAEAFAGRTGRSVVISSGDVYLAYGRLQGIEPGPPVPVPLAEDAPRRSVLYPYRRMAKPDEWIYSYEKILVEDVALQHAALNATVLRLPKVYGPGDGGHLSMLAGLAGQHGDWRWTHGYVEDVAHAIVMAALRPHPAGRVYNVGEVETRTVTQRLEAWNVRPAEEGPASHLVRDFNFAQDMVYDTGRIRRELGYRELVTYEEGMRRTLAAAGSQAD